MSGGGRRAMRAELEAHWTCWDATRPIRKEDFEDSAAPPPPEDAPAPAASDPNRAPEPMGGTITLEDLDHAVRFEQVSDAKLAALFGITEMDVREARKWARENSERLGSVTVTGIDAASGKITVQ